MVHDLRYAIRLLLNARSFTIVALLTLALGIGATTTIFSAVNALLIQPLPYPGADRLHMLWRDLRARGGANKEQLTPANYLEWRERTQSFDGVAIYDARSVSLTGGEPEQLGEWMVSHEFFGVLGVHPARGRDFTAADDSRNAARVAIVSHRLWTERFASDPSLVGRTIDINRDPHTVIGVMPASFRSPFGAPDVWRPIRITSLQRNVAPLRAIARRKAGVSPEQAHAELNAIAAALARDIPEERDAPIVFTRLQDELTGEVRKPLVALMGAVALVLLIACANVANLLLARAAGRSHEMAVRVAIGATPSRLVRQVLTESLVVGGAGAAGGLLVAWWSVDLLTAASPVTTAVQRVRIDGVVLSAGVVLALLASLVCGVPSALYAVRGAVSDTLKETGGKGAIGSRRGMSVRSAFIVVEMALALTLLVAAGLLMRSLVKLAAVDPGFRTERLLTARVSLPPAPYERDESRRSFYAELLERLRGTPGVEWAGVMSVLPFSGHDAEASYVIEDRPRPAPGGELRARVSVATPDLLRLLGMRLESGRLPDASDTPASASVVVVNRALASRDWPGRDPVGARILVGGRQTFTVVGVVRDVHHRSLAERPQPQMWAVDGQLPPRHMMTILVKAGGDPMTLAPALRSAVAAVDPNLPVANVSTVDNLVAATLALPRTLSMLMIAFAAAALFLAAIGIYGLIAYSVSERTREFGIRAALGADASDVLRLVMGHTARMTAIALVLGAIAAYTASRLMSALLFGVTPADPLTFAGTAALLAAVAAAAAYLPARRAASLNPVAALRSE